MLHNFFFQDVKGTTDNKEYSKEELYNLCIKEVPDYLRRDLCGSIKNKEEESTNKNIVPIETIKPAEFETQDVIVKITTEKTTTQKPIVRSTTTTTKVIPSTTEKEISNTNNFLGIPLELPVEVKKKSDLDFYGQVKPSLIK